MTQCIFDHVGSISCDFLDSNHALPNLHGLLFFGFTRPRPVRDVERVECLSFVLRCDPPPTYDPWKLARVGFLEVN